MCVTVRLFISFLVRRPSVRPFFRISVRPSVPSARPSVRPSFPSVRPAPFIRSSVPCRVQPPSSTHAGEQVDRRCAIDDVHTLLTFPQVGGLTSSPMNF